MRITSRRPSAVFAFPRLSGTALPLSMLVELGREGGVSGERDYQSLAVSEAAPLPTGSLLYSTMHGPPPLLGEGEREAGTLYLLLSPFTGTGSPECAWLRRARSEDGPIRKRRTLTSPTGRPSA